MAVSRLGSGGVSVRAVNAAKSVGRLARVDSILSRMATISHGEELAPPMLERILNADPILSQRIPFVVAAFCNETKQPIPGSICDAIRSFGYSDVRDLVMIVGIAEVYRELSLRCGLNTGQLTQQAIAIAVATEYLGNKVGQSKHITFSAGLFANIGVPVLAMSERGYSGIASSVAGGKTQLHEAEIQSLACSHGDAGYCLLTDYGFDEQVTICAAGHSVESSSKLVVCVHLAESFAHQLGFDGGFAIVPPSFNDDLFRQLGCDNADTEHVVAQITKWSSLSSRILA